jgi:hypothetical protein
LAIKAGLFPFQKKSAGKTGVIPADPPKPLHRKGGQDLIAPRTILDVQVRLYEIPGGGVPHEKAVYKIAEIGR